MRRSFSTQTPPRSPLVHSSPVQWANKSQSHVPGVSVTTLEDDVKTKEAFK